MSQSEDSYREVKNMEEDEEDMEESESDDEEEEDANRMENTTEKTVRVHLPDQPLEEGEELVMDDQAYLVYHQVNLNFSHAFTLENYFLK